jgi:hypothetical protein
MVYYSASQIFDANIVVLQELFVQCMCIISLINIQPAFVCFVEGRSFNSAAINSVSITVATSKEFVMYDLLLLPECTFVLLLLRQVTDEAAERLPAGRLQRNFLDAKFDVEF